MAFKGFGLLFIVSRKRLNGLLKSGCIGCDGNIAIGTSQAAEWAGGMGNLQIRMPLV